MKEKEPKYELPMETNPQNAEIGSKTMDKMISPVWLSAGNMVNEGRRAAGSGSRRNLRFVLIVLGCTLGVALLFAVLTGLGPLLEWLGSHV